MIRSITAATVAAASLLVTSSAFAQTAPAPAAPSESASQAHPISASLLVGYGFNDASPSGSTESFNLYGVGVGVRAGYTLPMNVYVGGTFVYHLGYSKDQSFGGGTATVKGHVAPLGVEGGYDFHFDKFTVRPYVGLGAALYSSSVSASGGGASLSSDDSGAKFALWPGVVGTYDLTDTAFVGADVRYTIVTGVDTSGGGTPNALGAYLNGGLGF